MNQILMLRPNPRKPGKLMEVGFERGMRAPSVEDIFETPLKFIEKLEESERVNVYYTVADCLEESGRILDIQHHIPFDVDKLDIPQEGTKQHLEIVARVVCEAIGVKFEETNVLFSGNGLQFLIGINEPITSVDYFDQVRLYYKVICDRINLRLIGANLKGQADPSVWSPARLMRYPNTLNRKPNKEPRFSRILNATRIRHKFNLVEASGLPVLKSNDTISLSVMKNFPEPDAKAIIDECEFIKWCQTHPDQVSEPQWYAALSITSRFPEGKKFSHKMSEGHPGYSFEETEQKIVQALTGSGPRTCKNISSLSDKCKGCKYNGTRLLSPILIEGPDHVKTANTGFYNVFVNEAGEMVKKRPDYQGLLKYFQREHPYKVVKDSQRLLEWTDNHFKEIFKSDFEAYALEKFDPYPESRIRNEFVSLAKITNLVSMEDFRSSIEGKMNFKNGVLDVMSGVLSDHSMEYGFESVLPCDYDPSAKCPRFEQFMREVTKDRIELIHVMQEYLGYAFSNLPYKYHNVLMLLGEGSNGKSTLVKVLRALAGNDAVSNLSLKNIQNDQNRANLEGKLINIAEENSRDAFKDTEIIKNISGGGRVNVKRVYVPPYEITVKAKFVILLNELPPSTDVTRGFFRRLLIVPFDQEFSDAIGNLDIDIDAKLHAELPGIFNWAMEGYRRLETQRGFTKSSIMKELAETYRKDIDPIHAWFEENCEVVADHMYTSRQKIFDDYLDWCRYSGIKYTKDRRPVLKYVRGKVLAQFKKEPEESRPQIDGDRVWVIHNIGLKAEMDKF